MEQSKFAVACIAVYISLASSISFGQSPKGQTDTFKVSSPSAPPVLNGFPPTVRILNAGTGGVLTPSGSVVILATEANTDNQFWQAYYVGHTTQDYYALKNVATGKCLDVAGGSLANGAQLTTNVCSNPSTSQWWAQEVPGPVGSVYNLRNLPSGKCMDAPVNYPAVHNWNGNPGQQYSCGTYNGSPNQFWVFRNY